METKKSIGLVGLGYWGKNILRNLHDLGIIRTACDFDAGVVSERKSKLPEIDYVTSFDDILRDPEITAVAIATPAVTHYELVKKSLHAGKDVFVEKPLALNVRQGQELVDLAEKEKRILMVGHVLQYHPAVIKLKELISSGELGKIQYIYSNRLNIGKLRTEENILWSFAPHDISVILLLLDDVPVSVSAFGGDYLNNSVYDTTLTALEFKNGVKGHIFVSWLHPFKEQKLIVVGSKAMAVFDDMSKDKLFLYPHKIEWKDGKIPIAQKADYMIVPIDEAEPLKEELRHFTECIKDRKKPKTDGVEGLQVLRILESAEKSLSKNPAVQKAVKYPQYFVHESAYIDENVRIGEGTKIWHFSHVLTGSCIGDNCIIGQNVSIGPDVTIGERCKIQNNVSIYKGVKLEDEVFCGPSCVFTNVYNPRAFIERKHEFLETLVKKGATIGANATIVCGVTIGEYAMIGAGATVKSDVPDYAVFTGVPARLTGWACKCGVTLKFNENYSTCSYCGSKYGLDKCGLTIINNDNGMKQIPMIDLNLEYKYMKKDIDSAIKKCLEHQHWILGNEVKELEEKVSGYIGVKHCIGVSSGTDALVLSLRALAIKIKGKDYWDRNDLIITTPFTFTATGDAILRAGATPVFMDIDISTYNINHIKIQEYLTTSSDRVVGLLPVHIYGQACNMDEIIKIAKVHNLFVLEDAAQAFGGMWNSRKLGSIGDAGAFSFFPSKNLGTFGDGGMVATNDDRIAELVRMLLRHGGKDKYNVDYIGYNARLDTIHASILLAKFNYIDKLNEYRRIIAGQYNNALKDINSISLPLSHPSAHHVYNQYTIRTTNGGRDGIKEYLKSKGINSMVYYPLPLHKMAVFGNSRSKIPHSLENAEHATQCVLSLPIEPLQGTENIKYITDCLKGYFAAHHK